MEIIISKTKLTMQLKLGITQLKMHHSDQWTHYRNNKAFTREDHPGQKACFMAPFHMSTTIMPYISVEYIYKLSGNNTNFTSQTYNIWGQSFIICYDRASNNSSSIIFNRNLWQHRSKFKTWKKSIENAAQISGQDTIHIPFSKMMGSRLSSANGLKAWLPSLTWMELKGNCACNSQLFHVTVMQSRLLLNWNKVQMSSLTCMCTTQVSFCLKFVKLQISLEFWQGT